MSDMGDRFWISGVQLGMLIAFNEQNRRIETEALLNKIEKYQHLGDHEELKKKYHFDLSVPSEAEDDTDERMDYE